jgi:zinc transporter 9
MVFQGGIAFQAPDGWDVFHLRFDSSKACSTSLLVPSIRSSTPSRDRCLASYHLLALDPSFGDTCAPRPLHVSPFITDSSLRIESNTMWKGLFSLLSFSLMMAVSSFLAGSLPLSFGLSQNHSRVISSLGTGLLIGTCMIIVIPEGIETLYSSAAGVPAHIPVPEYPPPPPPTLGTALPENHDDPKRFTRRQAGSEHTEREPHAWIGLSLIAGFITMYLIDQLPKLASGLSPKKPMHISLANLSQGPHRVSSPRMSLDVEGLDDFGEPLGTTPKSSATTIGLVIHAAADGIALAATSFISQARTGFIVFLALMIHKAPAAFGLTSVLLKQGRSKRQARSHLIVFSLAAPVAALTTWVLVNIFGGDSIGGKGTEFATGLLLLFSGGTFL